MAFLVVLSHCLKISQKVVLVKIPQVEKILVWRENSNETFWGKFSKIGYDRRANIQP